MRVLFPCSPLDQKTADGPFNEECECLQSMGVDCSLFDYDALILGQFKPRPGMAQGETILYRGWMLTPSQYEILEELVTAQGARLVTSTRDFVCSHHLPGWYENFKNLTPEARFFSINGNIVAEAERLGWERFFVKDFVKSNYGGRGSIANSPGEVEEILMAIRRHRGELEGGIALRKVEELDSESEVRYFVFDGTPYSPGEDVPKIVTDMAARHPAKFFSIDVAQRSDGELRLIEIGDGQVSDRKSWDVRKFCAVLARHA